MPCLTLFLATEETTEDSLKIIGYAWLPMVVWPLLTAQTIRHPQIF